MQVRYTPIRRRRCLAVFAKVPMVEVFTDSVMTR